MQTRYYDIAALNADLEVLKSLGAEVFNIGRSVLGRDIPCVFRGSLEGPQILIHASIHAREYITTPLVIEMMKNYEGTAGVWCVPMVNPDGVMLSQFGLASVPEQAQRDFLLSVNNDSTDFTLWKANARAVDLNVNYNADWGTGASNVTYPAPESYIGEYPLSEPESAALRDLKLKVQPFITLSYHSKGNVIFWGYRDRFPYPEQTRRYEETTGYPLLSSAGSAGGFKDWFVLTTDRIGLTVEVGSEELPTPVPLSALPEIYAQNRNVLPLSEEIAKTEWKNNIW